MLAPRLLCALLITVLATSASAEDEQGLAAMQTMQTQQTPAQLRAEKIESILAKLDPKEAAVIRETNRIRRDHGLSELMPEIKLSMAARDHSHDMRILGFFDHWSPVAGKSSHQQRAERYGSSAVSENILYGAGDAASAINMWMNSPPHRANILTYGWTRIGVGRSGTHYTQLFGN